MTIEKIILLILICFLFACNNQKEKKRNGLAPRPDGENRTEVASEQKEVIDYLRSAELFAKEVLKENYRSHVFDLTTPNTPRHLNIFQSTNLVRIDAYSNKTYPERFAPNRYEHFILFVATYDNQQNAEKIFDRIKSDAKYSITEAGMLGKETSERVRSLNIGAKPGGMIGQQGQQVFSLVKTCREPPMGDNWNDYEDRFLESFMMDEDKMEILNAYCGMNRYAIEQAPFNR